MYVKVNVKCVYEGAHQDFVHVRVHIKGVCM